MGWGCSSPLYVWPPGGSQMGRLGGSHVLARLSEALCPEGAAGGWFSCFSTGHCTTLNKVATAQRCRLSLSSECLATLQVTQSSRELPPSPDDAHIPPAQGAHLRPPCQPKEHPCRGHHPPPGLGLSHSRKRTPGLMLWPTPSPANLCWTLDPWYFLRKLACGHPPPEQVSLSCRSF